MDLYLHTTRKKLGRIFEKLGFSLNHGKRYSRAILKKRWGRLDAKFAEFDNKIYCDFHFDFIWHMGFLGVDNTIRPKEFFEKKLKKILEKEKIKFVAKEVNVFTKRNRVLLTGFRI